MTMNSIQSLNDQAAASLSGGTNGCTPAPSPSPCTPKLPSFPCLGEITLPVIKLPEICMPKISISWGMCKPNSCAG